MELGQVVWVRRWTLQPGPPVKAQAMGGCPRHLRAGAHGHVLLFYMVEIHRYFTGP